ncbi:MAG: HNH endonuclease [Bacteroidota bacterium]|nr:HNH endonuclease [Bacteroidota bacterium]
MDNLEEQINETFKDPESRRAIMRLVHNGGEQKVFSQWLSKETTEKGKKGLWNPMCLFRSYNLRKKDPGKELSNRIRAEIRAAVENECPFENKNWNRDENKKIYEKWKKGNENTIRETLLKNSEDRLETLLMKLLTDEIEPNSGEKHFEGALKQITVNAYERDLNARKKCIEIHGVSCIICGFNFEKQYGEIGKDFIHVHHIKPLSQIGVEYEIDPIKDLCPICPNCHAILHRKNPPYSIEEIKSIIP